MKLIRRKEKYSNILNTILFGKYEIISILGTGSSSTVYLAKHLKLKSYRAIKCIPKAADAISSPCLEANLLKHLNHPGIPAIYDVEEDSSYLYLVEEYVQGDSLDTFVNHQSYISQELIIKFGLELCDIFIYLHNLAPYPVLYQDLKPEHIILCENHLKLIDFGAANFFTGSGKPFQFFGTKEYSAHEILTGTEPSLQSDLYSIGKILLFLLEESNLSCSDNLKIIIQKAAAPAAADRYETVSGLRKALTQLQNPAFFTVSHLCKKIIVLGSKHGVGTTHISIALVNTLNQNGYPAIYVEQNNSDILNTFARINSSVSESNGIYKYKFFQGIPNYGNGIESSLPAHTLLIEDYGVFKKKLPEFDDGHLILFIMGSDEWDMEQAVSAGLQYSNREHTLFICSNGNQQATRRYAQLLGTKVYCFPTDDNPFSNTAEKEHFVFTILPFKRRQKKWFAFARKMLKNISLLASPEQPQD